MSEVALEGTVVNPETPPVETTPVVTPTIVAETTAPEVKPAFGDNWRQELAGTQDMNDKDLQRLNRFADPKAIWKSFRELENKISSGQFRTKLSDTPTDEELSAYRKELGVPDSPEDYKIEGVSIGEQDAPIVDYLAEVAHNNNIPAKAFNDFVNAYYEAQEEREAAFVQQQEALKLQSEEELRHTWGGNFIPNMVAIKNLVYAMPEGVGEDLLTARLPNGNILGNDAKMLQALANLALEVNPAGTVVPGNNGNQVQAIKDEIASIEHTMRTNRIEYQKNGAMRERYRQLIDARLKLESRGH